jgi:hypothetical protein
VSYLPTSFAIIKRAAIIFSHDVHKLNSCLNEVTQFAFSTFGKASFFVYIAIPNNCCLDHGNALIPGYNLWGTISSSSTHVSCFPLLPHSRVYYVFYYALYTGWHNISLLICYCTRTQRSLLLFSL